MKEWINVKDGLPPKNRKVLVFAPAQSKMQICVRRGGETVEDSWWEAVTTRNSFNSFTWKITHWMPLPDPPVVREG